MDTDWSPNRGDRTTRAPVPASGRDRTQTALEPPTRATVAGPTSSMGPSVAKVTASWL